MTVDSRYVGVTIDAVTDVRYKKALITNACARCRVQIFRDIGWVKILLATWTSSATTLEWRFGN